MATNYSEPFTHLGEITVATFLKEYWQKKPLLIRNAITNVPQLEADEIAGYSLDEDVESRILVETPTVGAPLKSRWQLHLGPQQEDTFGRLPDSHWTLLVQAVDQLNPSIQQLLHKFRFIPNWRVDDVMVSYASDQGSVGPHFDYYDVFLLQAQGSRLWKLGPSCNTASELRRDTDCKILSEFHALEEWVVNPGDLLYIPPQVSHWGIAQGECVTYSVGFRAPSHSEILLDFTQELASQSSEDERYTDKDLSPRADSGEITTDDIARVRTILQNQMNDDKKLAEWFGKYMTQAKRYAPTFEHNTENQLPVLAANHRAAYIPNGKSNGQCDLYINGESFKCSSNFASALCAYQQIDFAEFSADQQLIEELLQNDILV